MVYSRLISILSTWKPEEHVKETCGSLPPHCIHTIPLLEKQQMLLVLKDKDQRTPCSGIPHTKVRRAYLPCFNAQDTHLALLILGIRMYDRKVKRKMVCNLSEGKI